MTPTTEQLNQANHAMEIISDSVKSLNAAGIDPVAVATALASNYVHFVTAMAAALGTPKEKIIPSCCQALEGLKEFSDEIYDAMRESITTKEAA